MNLASRIAEDYGVRTVDVLTGLKYFGKQIRILKKDGKSDSHIFGFEESCGYFAGSCNRNTNAENAVFIVAKCVCISKVAGSVFWRK